MSSNYQDPMLLPVSEGRVSELFTAAMRRVYLWMTLGLMVTTAVSLFVISSETVLRLLFSNVLVFYGLLFGELALVLAISRAINKLSPATAVALFLFYAAVNGLTLSVIFLAYELGTIVLAFGTTAVLFLILSIVGYTTRQDLSKWGGILFMALIGLILASIANMFLASSGLDWIITYAGVLIFMGLTVYDTQRIKTMTYALAATGDEQVVSKVGVMGALRLYLDFINMFLYLLRLFGRRR